MSTRRFPYHKFKGYFEGIPTVAEWQKLTTIKTLGIQHSRNNPDLLSIDRALEQFEQSEATPFDTSKESAEAKKTRDRITALLLLGIAKCCMVWMEHKAQTDQSTRRKYVANLAMVAQQAADSLGLDLKFTGTAVKGGKLLKQSETIAQIAAQLRWKMAIEAIKHLGVGGGKKALEPKYWLETNPGGVNPQHIQGETFSNAFGQSHERFAFNFARKNPTAGPKVKYVTKDERWQYQVVVSGGLMYRRKSATSTAMSDLTLLDTGGTGYIFIIGEHLGDQGNFFCSMGEKPQGMLFHHSSIMSGVAVTFAGAIEAKAGKLTCIDNGSGHYKPGKEYLLEALNRLKLMGIALKDVKILYLAGMRKVPDGGGGFIELPDMKQYSNAESYLEHKGNIAPDD